MPTYEYACQSCGNHLEVFQRFTEDPLTECPQCGGQLRKVFGAVGIVLKGSGFYKTDSRSSSSASRTSTSSKEGTGESSSPSTPEKPSSSAEKKTDSSSKAAASA